MAWADRTTVLVDGDDESAPIQTSSLYLQSGPMVISVLVSFDSEGRSPTAAHDLARQLAEDYLERLG